MCVFCLFLTVRVHVCAHAAHFFKHVFLKFVCAPVCMCVFIIQGHSIAPRGSIPYPGRHGYQGHLSQRVPADQTGVHPDYVSPRRRLLGTFVACNIQVLVTTGENQLERKNIVVMSWSELVSVYVCVCVFALGVLVRNSVRFDSSESFLVFCLSSLHGAGPAGPGD